MVEIEVVPKCPNAAIGVPRCDDSTRRVDCQLRQIGRSAAEPAKFLSGIRFPKPDRTLRRLELQSAVGQPGPTAAAARRDDPPAIGSEPRGP